MTTKSDTPECDGQIEDARNVALDFNCRTPQPKEGENIYVVPADFARRLERERDEARREASELRDEIRQFASK